MNPESHSRGELAQPLPGPGAVIAAGPPEAGRVVPAPHSAMARPSPGATTSPMGLLRALRRRQTLALGVAILAAGICGPAAWFLVPLAKYKAQARLQVYAQTPKLLFRTVETENQGGEEYRRYQSTQQALVKSQLVLNAALQDEQVKKSRMFRTQIDAIAWLQGELKVEFIAGSEIMEISLSGDDPDEIRNLVNAVQKAYTEEIVNRDRKGRLDRYERLKKLKEDQDRILKEKRYALRKLAETVGSDDKETLALRQQLAMQYHASLQQQLLEHKSKKRQAQASLTALKAHETKADPRETPAPSFTEADVNQWIDQHPQVLALADKLDQQQDQLSSEASHMARVARRPGSDPSTQQLRAAADRARRELEKLRKELRPAALQALQQDDTGERVSRSGEIEQELVVLNEIERGLNEEIAQFSKVNHQLTQNTLDLQSNQDEIVQIQMTEATVGAEVAALDVELGAPARIWTVEEASLPRVRDDKKRIMMIGLITVGSFFAGLFGIAFLELQSRKVDSADEVPVDLGLSVVGALPILPARVSRKTAIATREKDRYWHNLLLESIDATRTMLVHAARTGSHRVVMIASAVGGEGKTSLASYLATSLARSGLRTVLVDADLRSPSIHRLFDLPMAAGLSELLRGEVGLAEAVGATAIEDLKILAAGRCDRQTIRVLAQGGIGPIFDQLKEQFDFVVVDSSPILPVADASLIAQHADAVLFSIFRDVSRKTKVYAASQRLQSLGVRILGAVVTGAHGGLYGNDYDSETSYYPMLPESAAASSDSP